MTGLLMKEEEKSELVYKFKTSRLHIEAQEPVDWVLDGEFGGSRTEVSVRIFRARSRFCALRQEKAAQEKQKAKIREHEKNPVNYENNC